MQESILGFAEYITHFTGALSIIRENGINAPPPQKNLISMVMSNAKEEPFKSHLEAYLKENDGEGQVTIDMLLEVRISNQLALYQKGLPWPPVRIREHGVPLVGPPPEHIRFREQAGEEG